eukprot:3209111-Pleurochrysis_carterae.AAC.2
MRCGVDACTRCGIDACMRCLQLRGDAGGVEVRAERLLVRVGAVAREGVEHELQRRQRQVDLVRVVLID